MAGFGTDTSQTSLNVRLPDGSRVELVGINDGVNGTDWSAALYDAAEQMKHLDVQVEERTSEDGVEDVEDDEALDHWIEHNNDIGDWCPYSGQPVPPGGDPSVCPQFCRASNTEDLDEDLDEDEPEDDR
jgi:hypothetical protein